MWPAAVLLSVVALCLAAVRIAMLRNVSEQLRADLATKADMKSLEALSRRVTELESRRD